MRRALIALLLYGTAGCSIQSGVPITTSFIRAQQVQTPVAALPKKAEPKPAAAVPTELYVSPTPGSMRGGTWVIQDFNQDTIYRLPLQAGRVTTVLLHDGEQLNDMSVGNYDLFVVTNSYVGSRPAISIRPAWAGVSTDMHFATTARIYSIFAYTAKSQINLVDFAQPAEAVADTGVAEAKPTPQGDYSKLSFAAPDGKPLPAWAPVEVWADSYKLVIRFQGPLPVLPALFAGQAGEQMISYRVVDAGGNPTMVTDRRVTEAQLRLDQEVIAITGSQPAPPHDWNQAATLPAPAPKVAVFVMPGAPDSQTFQASHELPPEGGI